MPRIKMRIITALLSVVLTFLLTGCELWNPSDPAAEATIAALSTENAQLATAVALLATPEVAVIEQAVSPIIAPASEPSQPAPGDDSAHSAQPASGVATAPFAMPLLSAEKTLAPADAHLLDLRLDPTANRLYVTDSAGQLHVLDATSLVEVASLPAAGEITLDLSRNRLFVAPASVYYMPDPAIAVVDTDLLTVTTWITGATHLSFDSEANRLFVGRPLTSPSGADDPPIRVVEGDTFATMREIPQPGIPVYNPLRGDLVILASTALVADPDQGTITQDLFPSITSQQCLDCVGGFRVESAFVFAEENRLALDVQIVGTAGGAGFIAPPTFYNATTLEPENDPAAQPVIQSQCGSQRTLQPLVDGRIYRPQQYARYVSFQNLEIYDQRGQLLTWFDGIGPPFVNRNTGQIYAGGWIFALPSLQPVGLLPPGFCLFYHDPVRGLLYGGRGNQLTILAERGSPPGGPANEAGALAGQPITQIVVSPDFARDQTIFAVRGYRSIYRSNDGGVEWLHLRDGMLLDGRTDVTLAISPAFGVDSTIFAGGHEQRSQGGGVFRSQDGGDHWSAAWSGLTHLRIEHLLLSPNFATDQTVLAYAPYQRIRPWETGFSVQRSEDGGGSWLVAITRSNEITPGQLIELLPGPSPSPTPSVRVQMDGRTVERTTDGGASWTAVDLGQPETGSVIAVLPADDQAGVVYVLGSFGLWRIHNQNGLAEQWLDERLPTRTFTNTLSALALSPPSAEGVQRLFIGTAAGEFWALDPAVITWAPVEPTTMTVTATPVASLTPVATPAPLTGEPPAGLFEPVGAFAGVWSANREIQQRLGWAQSEQAAPVSAAYQPFEHGSMVWRGDEQRIYVLFEDGRWAVFADTFREGDPESNPGLIAPEGVEQPVRGFGKVWREHPEVRESLGWATTREQAVTIQVQNFERGLMVWINGLIYALSEAPDGTRRWLVA
jgi:hypothetical protein